MKYSPKINDQFAVSPKLSELHPLQDPSTVQGALEILHETERFLKEVSGLDRFCLHPGGGSQAILGIGSVIRNWVDATGQSGQKDEIITTIFSHPSNPAVGEAQGVQGGHHLPGPGDGTAGPGGLQGRGERAHRRPAHHQPGGHRDLQPPHQGDDGPGALRGGAVQLRPGQRQRHPGHHPGPGGGFRPVLLQSPQDLLLPPRLRGPGQRGLRGAGTPGALPPRPSGGPG